MRTKLFLGILLLAGLPAATVAQEFRATLTGRVTDTTKARLPGASISAQNVETNETAAVVSNADGNYVIPFLRPGRYTVTVELAGFKKYIHSLRLEVSQVATINVELTVGSLSEEVSVTADTQLLDLSKADRGTVIDNRGLFQKV